ncbi:tripartite tricarboxylate transporter substrate binding protein [Roseomonas chloroacetimidivorans]|uniref:tripartite tricarboxylate transporter substrate binding protein n=1 Tax=Roseomonas chloroacetimidivorans TaxID=1766656 RepID=UPI003C73F3AE
MTNLMERRGLLSSALLATPALALPGRATGAAAAEAGGWTPQRPVQIIVGFAPGGASDIVARGIAQAAQDVFPVPVVVVNKPGAAGVLAAQQVARGPADGTQVVLSGGSETTSVPHYREVPYRPFEDFRHFLLLARYPLFLCVRADSPYSSLGALMAAAKEKPGSLSHGSSGVGSLYHSAFVVLNKRAGTEMLHVPYTGGGPTLLALAAGEITAAFGSPDEFKGLLEGGTLRLLAVASRERIPGFETVPTMIESGLDVFIENMKGLSAPSATPAAIVEGLRSGFSAALETPSWKRFAEASGTITAARGVDYTGDLRAMSDTIAAALRTG